MFGGGAEPGGKGVKYVVVEGGPGPGGDMDGGSDGGIETGGEGGRGYGRRDG